MFNVLVSPRGLVLLLALVLVSATIASRGGVSPASAACGGPSCLPSGPYNADATWNCGATAQVCLAAGTVTWGSASIHSWGWGSADYDGGGTITVCFAGEDGPGSGVFGSCGSNLARSCFFSSCVDQSVINLAAGVWSSGSSHTVNGHAKW
jgi:hypothetical protein